MASKETGHGQSLSLTESSCRPTCPVCDKSFPVAEIELHVDRCIFLNAEDLTPRPSNKRQSDHHSTPRTSPTHGPQVKRSKVGEASVLKNEDYKEVNEELGNKPRPTAKSVCSSIPLAEQMRPSELSQFVGQDHVLGQNKVLRTLLENRDVPSMIFWGPPGCGKTTLAHIIATQCRNHKQAVRFVKLSATMAGINDVKEVVKIASNEMKNFKRQTILFMDEIHRFNKLQQDVFLPHVESGTLTLIGATTENPSFSLNSALLSRCKVIVLEKLGTEQLIAILERALETLNACVVETGNTDEQEAGSEASILIEEASVRWLAEMCDGDARIALNSLQLSIQSKDTSAEKGIPCITLKDIKDGVKRSHLLYDRKGDQHYDIISAVHKSIRASDDNAALYWVTRMIEGGEDPRFIARRLVRAASEDIGLADPAALPLAVSVMQGCQLLGMPESDVLLAQCAIYLARAPKSREADDALARAKRCIADHQGPHPGVPLHLRNAPTRLMKDLGYGKGYNMKQKEQSNLEYMPEGLEYVKFFDK